MNSSQKFEDKFSIPIFSVVMLWSLDWQYCLSWHQGWVSRNQSLPSLYFAWQLFSQGRSVGGGRRDRQHQRKATARRGPAHRTAHPLPVLQDGRGRRGEDGAGRGGRTDGGGREDRVVAGGGRAGCVLHSDHGGGEQERGDGGRHASHHPPLYTAVLASLRHPWQGPAGQEVLLSDQLQLQHGAGDVQLLHSPQETEELHQRQPDLLHHQLRERSGQEVAGILHSGRPWLCQG